MLVATADVNAEVQGHKALRLAQEAGHAIVMEIL